MADADMGRLDLLDVYRDEDYTWRYDDSSSATGHGFSAIGDGFSVDSPLNGAERQGTRSSSGATGESEDA